MNPTFIAGDWGTSRLRLYLCADDVVIDRRSGPGAVAPQEPHQAILSALIAPWTAAYGALPVLLCGMVGSRNGWVEAPYALCPADVASLSAERVRFSVENTTVSIVPGVVAAGAPGTADAPDVMRGEETQVMGALALMPELSRGGRLLALPGTHTKWVSVRDGKVVAFKTALTGELFALLRDHSTLIKVSGADGMDAGEGFAQGLARYNAAAGGLLHTLFEVRSRQLIDGWGPAFALDFLSGLLIAADVEAGLGLRSGDRPITLIGDPVLTERYAQALALCGAATSILSGEASVLSGLRAIFRP